MGADWKPRSTLVLQGSGVVVSSAALLWTMRDSERAKLDSERAFRESPEGRLQEAVNRMMRPHDPAKAKEQVVARKAAVDASVVLARELILLGYSLRGLLDNEVVGARRR